jgi:hypothetical protein
MPDAVAAAEGIAANIAKLPELVRQRLRRAASRRRWSVEELDACFVVRDHNGQQLARVSEQIGQPQPDCDC